MAAVSLSQPISSSINTNSSNTAAASAESDSDNEELLEFDEADTISYVSTDRGSPVGDMILSDSDTESDSEYELLPTYEERISSPSRQHNAIHSQQTERRGVKRPREPDNSPQTNTSTIQPPVATMMGLNGSVNSENNQPSTSGLNNPSEEAAAADTGPSQPSDLPQGTQLSLCTVTVSFLIHLLLHDQRLTLK